MMKIEQEKVKLQGSSLKEQSKRKISNDIYEEIKRVKSIKVT